MDSDLQETAQKIQDAINHLKSDLGSIRAGRANPSLIEDIPVQVYGGTMKLQEVGTIGVPQNNLLTVSVWDASIIKEVIKSIQEANLGVNPSNEGQLIRLPLPALTEERRQEYLKLAHQKMEEARVEIRQIRQKEREKFEREMNDGNFGEDEFDRRSKILQEMVDKAIDQIETLGKEKQEQLMQV